MELGENQYGKAGIRLVRVDRAGPEHALTDLTISTALAGEFTETHLTGSNADVLPTDTQKNTAYAFARDGIGEIEDFALRLARHFVAATPAATRARVHIEQHAWERVGGHSFVRGAGTRTATATATADAHWIVSGVTDLTVLNTTGSEFHGFLKDEYTTLAETDDRILATAVTARWRHTGPTDWALSWTAARAALLGAFASTHSLSLQQTLFTMGRKVLEAGETIAEVRLSLPNKHHFPVDLAPFGLDNPGEVFHAPDRPYGLIEGAVLAPGAPEPGLAWW
ncbi:factor-independent urate hydroxylase [Actinokineospora sp. NPDC004072]